MPKRHWDHLWLTYIDVSVQNKRFYLYNLKGFARWSEPLCKISIFLLQCKEWNGWLLLQICKEDISEHFLQLICQSTRCESGHVEITYLMKCNDIMWVFHQDDERQARKLLGSCGDCSYCEVCILNLASLKQLKQISRGGTWSERVLLQCSVAAKQGTLPRPVHNQHMEFITSLR